MNVLQYNLEKITCYIELLCGRARARVLALRGARIGEKVSIGARCRIERPWCLEIGARVTMESDVYIKITDDKASIKFGDFVFIGRNSEFDINQKASIGEHSLIAPGCFITDHSHEVAPELRIDQQPGRSSPITIGKDVWLGANAIVLSGITIGDGAVVGAKSVVNKDVLPMEIVAGAPARLIRLRTDQSLEGTK